MPTNRILRIARLVATRPHETLARAQNSLGRTQRSTLRASPDWRDRIAELLNADYSSELELVRRRMSSAHVYDADAALTAFLYGAVRTFRPAIVVETGVARGVSTRHILEALDANEAGELWSVDLPPEQHDARFAEETWASAVDSRARWNVVLGYSRAVLPRVLRKLGRIDMFVHDSQHSQPNMLAEFRLAWRHLRPNGLLVSDDIHLNAAWEIFHRSSSAETIIVDPAHKAGLFGIAVKS